MGCVFVCVSGLSYGNWARNTRFLEFMIVSEKSLLVLLWAYNSPFVFRFYRWKINLGCLLQVSCLLVSNLIWALLVNKFLAISLRLYFQLAKMLSNFMQAVFVPVLIGNFYMGYILYLIFLVLFFLNLPILSGLFYG